MVLKAAAYTHIKRNNLKAAEALYERVLALAPESADDGYNYALILYTMGEYERAELVLVAHPFGMLENSEVILLHARILKAQGKPEAADRYHQWLETNTDPLVRYEYGLILEERGFYARAVEEFRRILKELTQDHKELKKAEAQYALARLLLKADPAGNEGIVELEGAVAGGFHDRERLETLLALSGISQSHKESIRRIIEKTPVQESGGKAP
jgi:tetratricopeptide (TPR) repeat protein